MKEIVIKIPDEDYKKICLNQEDAIIAHDACRRIALGVVLPEHHGDLVDKDNITVIEDVYNQCYHIDAEVIVPEQTKG